MNNMLPKVNFYPLVGFNENVEDVVDGAVVIHNAPSSFDVLKAMTNYYLLITCIEMPDCVSNEDEASIWMAGYMKGKRIDSSTNWAVYFTPKGVSVFRAAKIIRKRILETPVFTPVPTFKGI